MQIRTRLAGSPGGNPLVRVLMPVVLLLGLGAAPRAGQAPHHGVVKALADVKYEGDDKLPCLSDFLENGDPAAGASTFLLKAAPGCVVPKHSHTAEEQLIVAQGQVSAGMTGMAAATLGPGGFAMMPGKEVHWFTCVSTKEDCLMFVTFDQKYDIVWVKE